METDRDVEHRVASHLGRKHAEFKFHMDFIKEKNIWHTLGKRITFFLSFIITAYSTLRHKQRKGVGKGEELGMFYFGTSLPQALALKKRAPGWGSDTLTLV